jgi:hypothetical protein
VREMFRSLGALGLLLFFVLLPVYVAEIIRAIRHNHMVAKPRRTPEGER